MTRIITELCQNHNGDMDVLRKMIESSKEGGSDIVKIQSIKADTLTKRKEYESFRKYNDEYERFKTLELTYDNIPDNISSNFGTSNIDYVYYSIDASGNDNKIEQL